LFQDSGAVSEGACTVKFTSAAVSSEIEASVLPQTVTGANVCRSTGTTTVQPALQTPGATQALSKPKRRKALVAIAAVIAVALIAGAYLYWPRGKKAAPIESIVHPHD